MEKITLYHYTSNKIKDNYLRVKYYGYNWYTKNDVTATPVKRLFFFTTPKPLEYRFKGWQYRYTVSIDKNFIYDLRINKLKLPTDSITNLLNILIKKGYKGIIYNVGYDVVNLFYDVKINNKSILTKVK